MRIKGKGLQSSRMVTFAPSLVAGETVLNLTRDPCKHTGRIYWLEDK